MSLLPAFRIGVWNAWLFMSVFLLQMVAAARVTRSGRYAGIAGNLVWLIALLYSLFLPLRLGTSWFYVGLTVFLVGLAVMAAATWDFITAPQDEPITKGAYSFSRHPMYLATLLICVGAAIAGASWLFIVLSAVMAVCFRTEAMVEEAYCLRMYGAAYREYIDRTPRWAGVRATGTRPL
jgi:protein-S-isoprenylcysteine O-methyltransferase Ste14